MVGLTVPVCAVGTLLLRPAPPSRITPENCNRIELSLSRAEVEAILGPPGDYTTMAPVPESCSTEQVAVSLGASALEDWRLRPQVWAADGVALGAGIDSSGEVTGRATYR